MNILVVDNDERIVALVGAILGSIGHRITATTDARQAIEAIERGDVDLLLSDVVTPAMTGSELAAEARRRRPGLPVLLMFESASDDGYAYVAKPFQAQGLLNGLHQALALSDVVPVRANTEPTGAARTDSPPGLRRVAIRNSRSLMHVACGIDR